MTDKEHISDRTWQLIRDEFKQIREGQEQIYVTLAKFRREMNGRVRKLEIWRGYITGGLAVIVVAAALIKIFL
ncbi:MAG: hypothetical protein ACYTEQ_28720, partial [Planctomycetota bacterium]|jgi:hypothetical protein